ncbi:helix-loop-helix DNA-binding domain-containing protein [Pilobolus umbonatus]|nr:helix-loop-helix DNA-binding domain-containing protein [Pilobolus umbonatus]
MYSPTQQDFKMDSDHYSNPGITSVGTPHTTVGAMPVVRNNRVFNPSYQLHQRQSSFGTVASMAMSPPVPHNRMGMTYGDTANSQNWFGTSIDSTGSSFGQSPIFAGRDLIISPSTSASHLDGFNGNEDDENQQRNLQEMFDKRRRRRESHNAVERRRRDNINERIHELCTLLPERLLETAPTSSNMMTVSSAQGGANGRAINKGAILKLSVDHIKELREDVNKYQERIKELERMIDSIKRGEMLIDDGSQLLHPFDENNGGKNGIYMNHGTLHPSLQDNINNHSQSSHSNHTSIHHSNNNTNTNSLNTNTVNTANTNNNHTRGHERMGSLQFQRQFNKLQIGNNSNNQ